MIKRSLGCAAVLCGLLIANGPLQAHHSLAGVYDMKAEKEVTGTVEKVQFVNPHGSLTIQVKNPDASTTDWTFTLGYRHSRTFDREAGRENRTKCPPRWGRD